MYVAGIGWDESVAEIRSDWLTALVSPELCIDAGSTQDALSLMLFSGTGGWSAVRRQALGWAGRWTIPVDGPIVQPKPRPHIWARLEPEIITTLSDQVQARLVVDTLSRRPSDGQVVIETARGLETSLTREPVRDLTRQNPVERDVLFKLPEDRPGVYQGEVKLSTALAQSSHRFHVVRLGTSSPVEVEQGALSGLETWTLSNGESRFIVCPAFGPSMIAWYQGGENQLYSAFPKPIGLSWTYPWFGGLHVRMHPTESHLWPGVLHLEHFNAEAVTCQDARGLPWRGVRLSTRPERKQLKDIYIELDFLTVGAANLLKFVYRVRNLRDTRQIVSVGTTVAAGLGAAPVDLVLHGEDATYHPKPWGMEISGQKWGALTNNGSGRTLLMTSPHADVRLDNQGQAGRMLGSGCDLTLPGEQTRERVYYLVLADSLASAKRYRLLGQLGS
jgi:hypothetical protein